MKFDLFYELTVPQTSKETVIFENTLNEACFAEHCGFNTAWLVEHHFMTEYSHSSSPSLFLSALAQRTQSLRLGLGIIPLPYHHPIHIAEMVATLDILSQGRVECGIGRGFSPKEYEVFQINMSESRAITEESLTILKQAWQEEPLCYQGQYYQFDQLPIHPKPLQKPYPPLWTAAVSPESFIWAAQQGLGVLIGPFKPWFMIEADIKIYKKHWYQHHPHETPRIAMTLGMLCLEDKKQAKQLAKQPLEWFYQKLLEQTFPVLDKLYKSYEYYRRFGHFKMLLSLGISYSVLENLGLVLAGDPQEFIHKIKNLQKHGITHILCAIGAGLLDTEIVKTSMQTMQQHVIPHFQTEYADSYHRE